MKVAILCANGRAGALITGEAISRGLDVTAFIRSGENRTAAPRAVRNDLFDLTAEDLKGYDVVVDAFGAWEGDAVDGIARAAEHLCDILSGSDARLLIVGGAGSLYTDPEHTACVADAPDFPASFRPVARAHAAALEGLRKRRDVKWTYVSPACDFRVDGPRTGRYLLGGEELVLNEKKESVVSYADYAIAMVDEILSGNHVCERIGVAGA